ncbi:RED family protein [Babesia ovata]|uniref:RED family protein n=1 Tax=Babesia ovata TaxID=189622 RepID=A0A2H6K8C4_9APIC|nr:RED family protein [Babesia ovata]GBE59241.1 RED family protein [Babesia ovata]
MAQGGQESAGRRPKESHRPRNNAKNDATDSRRRHQAARHRPAEPEQTTDGNYRDRAFERSQLKDDYYKKIVEEHALLKAQTEEESRYMVSSCLLIFTARQGGDEEHTHLVKGLDYVLLEKVRKSLAPRVAAERAAEAAAAAAGEEIGHSDLGRYIYRTFIYHTHMHHRQFHQRLSKTYSLVCQGYKFKRKDADTQTFYTLDLSMEPSANDVPSTVVAKGDPEKVPARGEIRGCLPAEIKNEIAEALQWHQENRKKPKEERLHARPLKAANGGSGDDSDDIFADAGEYRSNELNTDQVTRLKSNEKYFDEESEDEAADDTYQGPSRLQVLGRRKRTAAVADGYDECYPSAADVDSDDETGGKGKKSRGNRAEWRKIEKIIADKAAIPMEQLERISTAQKQK